MRILHQAAPGRALLRHAHFRAAVEPLRLSREAAPCRALLRRAHLRVGAAVPLRLPREAVPELGFLRLLLRGSGVRFPPGSRRTGAFCVSSSVVFGGTVAAPKGTATFVAARLFHFSCSSSAYVGILVRGCVVDRHVVGGHLVHSPTLRCAASGTRYIGSHNWPCAASGTWHMNCGIRHLPSGTHFVPSGIQPSRHCGAPVPPDTGQDGENVTADNLSKGSYPAVA